MKRLLIGLLKDIARYALVGVSLIVALFASAIYLPLLKTSHQDACDFGPVSNDEYRTYLAEVVRRQQVKWGAFTTDINQITRELNNRLSDLLAPEDRVYVRVAEMHAI